MLVSIIVPCYNYGHLLKHTLISIQNQSYENWEAIIVDDGSSDNTKQIAEEYASIDNRYKYIYQNNSGLSAARNTGILNANGDLFQFLDADDLLSEKKLMNQVSLFKRKPSMQLCFTNVKFFYVDENNDMKYYDRYKKGVLFDESVAGYELIKRLVEHNFTVVNAPVIARKLVEKVGCFNTNLYANEDWDYWFRCAMLCSEFIYCDHEQNGYALVRGHPGSMSTDLKKMANGEIHFRKRMIKYLNKLDCSTERLLLNNFLKIAYLNYVFINGCYGLNLYLRLFKAGNSKISLLKSFLFATMIKLKLYLQNKILPITGNLKF